MVGSQMAAQAVQKLLQSFQVLLKQLGCRQVGEMFWAKLMFCLDLQSAQRGLRAIDQGLELQLQRRQLNVAAQIAKLCDRLIAAGVVVRDGVRVQLVRLRCQLSVDGQLCALKMLRYGLSDSVHVAIGPLLWPVVQSSANRSVTQCTRHLEILALYRVPLSRHHWRSCRAELSVESLQLRQRVST